MTKSITVVGNKFESFARNAGVMRLEQLEHALQTRSAELDDASFELGQGVSEEAVRRLVQLAEQAGHRDALAFSPITKCGFSHVHKTAQQNSMLSLPRRVDLSSFEADVWIDDSSELFQDHLSGQHLPGMALIEAARQMILAVTEEFYAQAGAQRAFVWSNINIAYTGYAFPVKTLLSYHVTEIDASQRSRTRYSARMTFWQGSASPCTATSDYEVYEERIIRKLEQRLASAAVS